MLQSLKDLHRPGKNACVGDCKRPPCIRTGLIELARASGIQRNDRRTSDMSTPTPSAPRGSDAQILDKKPNVAFEDGDLYY